MTPVRYGSDVGYGRVRCGMVVVPYGMVVHGAYGHGYMGAYVHGCIIGQKCQITGTNLRGFARIDSFDIFIDIRDWT